MATVRVQPIGQGHGAPTMWPEAANQERRPGQNIEMCT